ncbi:glycosyltransferase family 4 protein [Pseudomonas psychrophila]|uniref:Glycosyltransferase involved in cell wall bisynthesis n=1 Tax=Pseudomonas psychrophila TaxID=122355 RepID=A0ABY0VT57_9PSED|nr:glycosyltransferase family 4 protein [Pseudomonas psychrophila]KAB0487717.1 glycosyltransferase family 4 protein [Pseudomonas psychrophila]KMM97267.1 glycosyltransferase [Pseudomonas psychrophila]QIE32869.1 glycosyltransferase family 4 protein [Pseudomonas psychrophila]WVI99420.1 glycosyltransferase family 4 protein [Pseudomonas psychrophila]SDU53999.1 Glycosyltransferase involved in cell wall bisynthesis [Pseudomonas psychrophila]
MGVRVLLLTQWFDPEPTFKGLVFARALVKQGFEVEVVTGFPNYPGGKIYPGFKLKLFQREFIDGVKITRLPLYPSHGQSGIGRVFNYVSFAAASLFYGVFFAKRPDVIYAYHPPLTVGIAASIIRFFRRVPVLYDIQDMWPDTLKATGMFSNDKLLGVVSKVCDWVYRHVDKLVVLSPGFKKVLIERGVPEDKIEVIYNWCAEEQITASAETPICFSDNARFRILFAGNMGKAQALDAVLDAAYTLQSRSRPVEFIFLGGGIEVDALKRIAIEKSLTNVTFLPAVPMAEVGGYLKAADALLVHLKKDPLFKITIPSKTQAYMAVGRPLLMAVDGDAAELVKQSGCGVVVESENVDSLVSGVELLLNSSAEELALMSQKGHDFYRKHLSLDQGVLKFSKAFNFLAKK